MARRFDSSLDDPATLAALGLTPADIALIKNQGSGGGTTNTGNVLETESGEPIEP